MVFKNSLITQNKTETESDGHVEVVIDIAGEGHLGHQPFIIYYLKRLKFFTFGPP